MWEDTAKIVDGDFNVRIGVPLDSLFEHMSDAMWALKEQNGPAIKEYYDSIETTNDLVRFGYEHAISPDAQAHTDWFAREAYRIKARELCGLEL
ncbi:MAG: hypothetical protein HDQ88_11080 [Clostridia bacterium]|nr:hypothetical protein [Clostridia bacterium]